MKKDRVEINIILNGDIFKEINEQYEKEQELMQHIHMIDTEMGEIYKKVFQCNENIKLINSETFGNIFIDDNHVVVEWDIDGCIVEFYYEQFWDIMEMTIDAKHNKKAIAEIVKAFQNYYNKKFTYNFVCEDSTYTNSKGENEVYSYYKLEIFEGLHGKRQTE